ncbi:MAG: hypothetical protein H7289_09640 [Mucilaginibacter sp.]|nr:hypothetical protein [Mucilaginibacter sp.]
MPRTVYKLFFLGFVKNKELMTKGPISNPPKSIQACVGSSTEPYPNANPVKNTERVSL